MIAVFQYLFAAAWLQISLEALEMVCFLDLMAQDLDCFYHACALSHLLSREQQIREKKEMNKELDEMLESFRNDDGNGNDNARKQWYDWMNGARYSCCTCDTHSSIFLWRSLQNNNISKSKWTLKNKIFIHHIYFNGSRTNPFAGSMVCLQDNMRPRSKNPNVVTVVQMSIFKWRFRCRWGRERGVRN